MLITIAIVAVFAGLLVPGIIKQRETAAREQCANNLKQIGLAIHNFESNFKRLPPLYGGNKDGASLKFPNVWGSTHLFLKPYIEQDSRSPRPVNGEYVPDGSAVIPSYVCRSDPSVVDGMIGPNLAATSYTANAQVFAPLTDETLHGGNMRPGGTPDYCDRGSTVLRLQDGSSNIIGFIHSYSLCGSSMTGTAWGYTAGPNQPPASVQSFQPWSRATYLGQSPQVKPGEKAFQVRPAPYLIPFNTATGHGCDPKMPATPHAEGMVIILMDASVRTLGTTIDPIIWNKACMPNDGQIEHHDWTQ